MSEHLVTEASTFTAHNKHKPQITLPSANFEPAIPAIKRSQNYALEGTATGVGWNNN
jgi:hypothetical protein